MSESARQDSLAGRVEEALRAGAPGLGVDRIVSVERLTTGLSSKSYRVCAETTQGPATWVMRVEPDHGVIPPYDIPREYHLLAQMGEAGLPVPEVLHLERDAAAVGGRFMLMSFVEGEVYRSSDARLVERIYQKHKILRRSETTRRSKIARCLITPRAIKGMFGNG